MFCWLFLTDNMSQWDKVIQGSKVEHIISQTVKGV